MRRQTFTLCALLLVVAIGTTTASENRPPRIIKQPPTGELLFKVADPQKESANPFILECEVDAQPEPEYQWIKNGKNYSYTSYDNRIQQQRGRGTLMFMAPQEEDIGQYQCFATNEFGTATSNTVFVRKAELNGFKEAEPKTVIANEGEPFSLPCEAPDGWPKPRVDWMLLSKTTLQALNNSRLTVDPEGTLWFSNVTREDATTDFFYACSVSSLFRDEFKLGDKKILEVRQTGVGSAQNKHELQKQYTSRKNEVALRGKDVELFCIYGGTPLPQTVWKKNSERIEWGDRITQGRFGKSLVIRNTMFEDAGTYTCDVSNGVGRAQSYSIYLTIRSTPYFTKEPEIQNMAEGETVEFRCEAAGNPEPEIHWIHNGKPIGKSVPNTRRTVENNLIRITDIQKTDTGNYGCNATNAEGYVYKDVYLNVLALPPEIQEPPRKMEATVEGKNITMRCRVFGAPKPEVKWSRNGIEITGGRFSVQASGDLAIQQVTFGDAGNYTCFAKNRFGNKTAHGSLVVRDHTRITEGPQNYEVSAGQPATFRCNEHHDDTLEVEIEWWKNGQVIDSDDEARFFITNDHSLNIKKTVELDTGEYTCVVRTELDQATATAYLIVQDVPNKPELTGIECMSNNKAKISWEPKGDNRSPILHYTIEYNTSFTPSSWDIAFEKVPATEFSFVLSMTPWANYTYRVIAFNKVGRSEPSRHSDPCTTPPDVPYKNPENVVGQGTEPNNLVITWTAMPEIEHNAPNFQYRVSWKRDIPAASWDNKDIYDWHQNSLVIPDQPTFERYLIKVVAINERGEANVAAEEIIGFSGEDRPLEAPTNFSMKQVISATQAVLTWNPVSPESVRGHFKGYKIQTWSEFETEEGMREIHVKGDANSVLVESFKPDAKNYARVLAYNGRFNGPPSAVIDFNTPEGVPSPVQSLDAYPLGSSAFWLTWKKPLSPNGKLTGYKVYYEKIEGSSVSERREYDPHITDPRITTMKLGGLQANTKYRITVTATTRKGEGADMFIEKRTLTDKDLAPAQPSFTWERELSENGYPKIRVNWLPSQNGHAGTHFFTKYRAKGDTTWIEQNPELNKDYQEISGLNPQTTYEFLVVSVDGQHETPSEIHQIDTNGVDIVPNENVAIAGWFIGMMLALAIIIILFIIVCIIRRNRGGKYDVHDRELANGRRDYPDEGGFHEYSQPLDNKSAGRQSVNSASKPGVESDTDSMAEYGDGDTGLNEDGSFIGQYGRKGL